MSPADLMALTGALVEQVRNMSAAMQAAVNQLVEDGWTEAQAREVVVAMMVSGMRGQATPAEDGEVAA